jgi:hypothetical protein
VTENNAANDLVIANSRLSLEAAMVPPGSSVLAIGLLDPHLAGRLVSRGCELARVADVEVDAAGTAHIANPQHFDYLGVFGPDAFDVLLIADALDELPAPALVMRSAMSVLRTDGAVIMAAFNAAHGSLRLAGLAKGSAFAPSGPRASLPTMTWRAVVGVVAQAGLEVAEAKAVIVDVDDGPVGLPVGVADWVREQPGAYDHEYVVRAVRLGASLAPVPIAATPAAPLPRVERGPSTRPVDADALVRVEKMLGSALDALERAHLRDRDAAIGVEVASATFRKDLERLAVQFHRQVRTLRSDYRDRENRLRRELNQRLRDERAAMRRRYERSATWRIGRLVTLPVRALTRLVRRG